ncbi:MAG TPA: cyclic nucleotide-binding domain-containing protein [Melioribacteraceae bacterium]|nr:cyclic nucleotide-binding domain-containing protein [Melioribacteraceae bacterium]
MQKVFTKGEIISYEGELNFDLYILVEGKIGIYKKNILIREFDKRGTIIGEMSVILKTPRTATIRAVENSTLLVLKSDLDLLIKYNPDVVKKIIRSLAERLKDITEEYYQLSEKVLREEMLNKDEEQR